MPSDTVYTTTLREPFAHLRSAFRYFGLARWARIPGDNPLETFLQSPQKYDDIYTGKYAPASSHNPPGQCLPFNVSVVKNGQALDLGFPLGFPPNSTKHRDQTENATFIESWIKSIEKRFHLVMITEYLHESLVLWRRLMCWDLADVIHYSKNVGNYKGVNLTVSERTMMDNFRKWSDLEFRLYDHFNRTLWEKIALEGSDFWEEVDTFNEIQKKVKSFCESKVRVSNWLLVDATEWNQEVIYSTRDCTARLFEDVKTYYDSVEMSEAWNVENGPRMKVPDLAGKPCLM